MSREETFWNRVIELSKKTFKKEIFDYFVLTSRLIKVDQQEAIIYLDAEVKKLFWEENMTKVILTAGFEIYAVELTISYQFNLEEEEEEKEFIPLSEMNRDYAVSHTPIIWKHCCFCSFFLPNIFCWIIHFYFSLIYSIFI